MRKSKEVSFEDSSLDYVLSYRKKVKKRYSRRVFLIRFAPIVISALLIRNIIVLLIAGVLWFLIASLCFDHRDIYTFDPSINIWFGVPGSGKTSMAALLTRYSVKSKIPVLSNVQISGALKYDVQDLGRYDMSFNGYGAHLILDEATLSGLDNRLHAEFIKTDLPLYFSIHRHMNNRVDVFSQGYDIDKRVRDRAGSSGLYHLIRLPIKGLLCYRRIKRILYINKDDKQMIDGFSYRGLPKLISSRKVWSSFDTLDKSLCPGLKKDFKPW